MSAPNACHGCKRPALSWTEPNGCHLVYCRGCRRYLCTGHCGMRAYAVCSLCSYRRRDREEQKARRAQERLARKAAPA